MADDRDGAVVAAYVHSREVCYNWHHSMIEMLGWDLAHQQRVMRGGYVAIKSSTGDLAGARNKAVKLFLAERQADWLWWVDTDMGFAPDTIDRLFAAADPAERPVVGGLAFTQREEIPDQMGGFRCRATPTIFDWAALDDGQMGFTIRWEYNPDALTRVAGTGSACVLIHRSVFERVEEKFGPVWYDRVPNTTTGQVVSEDLALCLRAGALDIPIHVHTGVRTAHQKTLWLAEDDYFGQVMLSRIPPQVPPASEPVAVIVPVLWRPQNAAPFMESLAASGAGPASVYAVADESDAETRAAWEQAGATVIVKPDGDHPGTFAEKANLGYQATAEPWLFLVGDDVAFQPGWLDQAMNVAAGGADVVGTNDLHNPRVLAGEHSGHLLIRRTYIDGRGASWDGPKVVCHEGYTHNFVDNEIVTVAKQRAVWAMAIHAKAEHLHPLWGGAPDDDTYRLGKQHVTEDRDLFTARRAQHGLGTLDIAASVTAVSRQNAGGAVKIWEDLERYAAVITADKPDVVIECGTWAGGSAAWFAAHGVDVVTIDHAPQAQPPHPRVTYLTGDTRDPAVAAAAAAAAAGRRVMVVLDSDHTRSQVAAEIRLYGPLVTPGCHLVVEDGIVRWIPAPNPYTATGGPLDAVEELLLPDPGWVRDRETEDMHPVSMHPMGWWRRA